MEGGGGAWWAKLLREPGVSWEWLEVIIMHIFEHKHKAGKSTSTVQPLVQWQMLCLSPLVTQLLNVRIWPLWSHMRLSVDHRDHPLLHPPPLLLHWGPRRILTLAVAARNEQRHKDSVIPRTTDWQKPQLTGTSRSSAKVSQRKEPSALWTIPEKIIINSTTKPILFSTFLATANQNQHNGRRHGWGADSKR